MNPWLALVTCWSLGLVIVGVICGIAGYFLGYFIEHYLLKK